MTYLGNFYVTADGQHHNQADLSEIEMLRKQRDVLLAMLVSVRSKMDSHAQATAFYGDQPELELECLAIVEPAIASVKGES